MAKVEMYTKAFCPFCIRAKALLKKKGVDVIDIPAAMDRDKRKEMNARSGGANTFPQIFIEALGFEGCRHPDAIRRKRRGEYRGGERSRPRGGR